MAEMSQLKMEGMNEEVLMEDSRYLHANEQCWKMIDYLSLSFSVDHIVYCDNEETSLRAAVVAPVAVAKGTVLHMGVAACTAFLFVTGSFDRAIWVFICLIFLNLYFLHCIHQPVTSQDPPRAGVVFLLKAIVGCASIYHCYTYPLFDFFFSFLFLFFLSSKFKSSGRDKESVFFDTVVSQLQEIAVSKLVCLACSSTCRPVTWCLPLSSTQLL